MSGTPTNNYTVTVADAHSHTLTYTIPAADNASALSSALTERLSIDTTAAGFVATDTWTVTAAIA